MVVHHCNQQYQMHYQLVHDDLPLQLQSSWLDWMRQGRRILVVAVAVDCTGRQSRIGVVLDVAVAVADSSSFVNWKI